MIRETVTYKDFFRIARENDYFLWHFIQKNQDGNTLGMLPILDSKRKKEENSLLKILGDMDIPYYESYVEDSVDFLTGFGIKYSELYDGKPNIKQIVDKNYRFRPVIIGFKKFQKVSSTYEYCYCPEGTVSVIGDLNPKLLEELLEKFE